MLSPTHAYAFEAPIFATLRANSYPFAVSSAGFDELRYYILRAQLPAVYRCFAGQPTTRDAIVGLTPRAASLARLKATISLSMTRVYAGAMANGEGAVRFNESL